ncbi:hypothetical protein SAMN06265795_102346 [Noviherbaspirillum humi]|uniref:Glycosyltransferase 2-like domain-containing protein n=1 Tax=Noviherbaspirillum humi TaxID=1688639 RepID=A0A239DUJ4_9BURK|nr:glycosyltransferase [Noviherbaspirillum humi]SNS35422.1 hypothetical protein SAMN06265795_102346 [Noviherbaspirillum humi]
MSKVLTFSRSRRRPFIVNEEQLLGVAAWHGSRRMNGDLAAMHAGSARLDHGGMPELLASVIVPAMASPEMLNRCLASLALQEFDCPRFEVIVVDMRADEATREVIERWRVHTALTGPHIISLPSPAHEGLAAARNRGWRVARGAIVAFIDEDAVARSDWLAHGLQAFRGNVQAAWGRLATARHEPEPRGDGDGEAGDVIPSNFFCRRHVLNEIDGFDERFSLGWRESADFYFRLLQSEARVAQAPQALISRTPLNRAISSELADLRKMQYDALLFKKHPDFFRQKLGASVPWHFYLIVAMLGVFAASLWLHAYDAMAMSATVWTIMTTRLCLRRIAAQSAAHRDSGRVILTSLLMPPVAVFWRIVGALRFRSALL